MWYSLMVAADRQPPTHASRLGSPHNWTVRTLSLVVNWPQAGDEKRQMLAKSSEN